MDNQILDKENPSNQDPMNQPKIEITVKRHKQLFDLLNEPAKMWRVLVSLFLLIIILFIGLAFVVISIKKFYPYNIIETNVQGATIVKNEDKDVIYWLFNTADLWANSGIEVQEGDILTIRASGSSFTAIHHLVDASEKNRIPQDKWVGTEGQPKDKDNPRDLARSKYRLCHEAPEGILLMKIIDHKNAQQSFSDWGDELLYQDIEVIGKERTLYISKSGILHFAVNDIVLTDSILDLMYHDYIYSISVDKNISNGLAEQRDTIINSFKKINQKEQSIPTTDLIGFLVKNNSLIPDSLSKLKAEKTGIAPGRFPKTDSLDYESAYPLVNELVYYKQKKFKDAWYVDNLGSFLIVIERKRK